MARLRLATGSLQTLPSFGSSHPGNAYGHCNKQYGEREKSHRDMDGVQPVDS